MPPPTLRPYQLDALDAIEKAWATGTQSPALVLATGLGKTVVLAELVRRAVRDHGRKPIILAHRKELIDQTVAKLLDADPGLLVGVIQANRHEVDPEVDVVVASVQTLQGRLKPGRKFVAPGRFDLLIQDEAHHGSAKTYLKIYDHFQGRTRGSGVLMLGVTATLERGDGIALGHVWNEVIYEFGTKEGIEGNYLVNPRAFRVPLADLDLGKVQTTRGDYSDGDLGRKMIRAGHRIGEAILEHGYRIDGELRRGITFAPTVECAEDWCAEFNKMGIESRVVTGGTPMDERRGIYRLTAQGIVRMIVSVMCLTEGFDLPAIEMAVIGRPTKSVPLYVQMLGRVLRPSPGTGKVDALILDVCGAMGKQAAICLNDLTLPEPCACDCDCTLGYLCKTTCACPTGSEAHSPDCGHHCRQIGAPSFAEPTEVEIDDSQLVFASVDLFTGRRADRVTKNRSPWLLTKTEVPFLPSTATFEEVIFLWRDADGTWSVGEKPKHGPAKRLETGLTFEEARLEALASYPYPKGAPILNGAVSPAQTAALWRLGVEVPEGCTKQAASDRLNIEFVSRWLKR